MDRRLGKHPKRLSVFPVNKLLTRPQALTRRPQIWTEKHGIRIFCIQSGKPHQDTCLAHYNRKGVFSNSQDSLGGIMEVLSARFRTFTRVRRANHDLPAYSSR